MWEHHHGDLAPRQIRNDGVEKISYSLGVYPEECNQAKTSPHGVVQRLQSQLDQSSLGADGDDLRKVECPDFWSCYENWLGDGVLPLRSLCREQTSAYFYVVDVWFRVIEPTSVRGNDSGIAVD